MNSMTFLLLKGLLYLKKYHNYLSISQLKVELALSVCPTNNAVMKI